LKSERAGPGDTATVGAAVGGECLASGDHDHGTLARMRGVIGCQCAMLIGMLLLLPELRITLTEIVLTAQRPRPALAEYLQPQLGEEALTPVPREVVELVRELRLQDFSLSPGLAQNEHILQRVTEGNWPTPLTGRSANLFLHRTEGVPARCEVRERRKSVVYAHCS
jgi:hypothetical protein